MPEVGKVKYTVEVDTSGIAQDVKKAEKEIEKSNIGDSLDANVSAGAGKASASVKKATGDIDASVSTSSKLTTAASVALGGAMVMAGEYALEFGANMVDVAVDYDSALSQMQAATGASAAEMESLGEIMESIYAGNYGEDFGDIADAIATVKTNIGDLNDSDLQNLTESAITLRDTFGYDITESTRAAKAMMDNFGVSGDEAMNLIATGAQNGLDYSGELLDSISEYSVQFQKLGLSADDMFKIIEKGAETGAWNVDKIGDAVKEMSIRVIDGSETTRQGFETVGLSADEMSAKFAAGGETARDAFFETIEALAAMEDPIAQNSAGVALFGTMWEDLGPEVVTALAEIEDGAYATGDALEKMKEVKYDNLGSALEGIGRSLEVLLLPVIQALLPFLTEIIEAILPLLQALLDPLVAILEAIVEPILGIIEALMPLITIILETLTPVLQTLGELFSGVFSQILTVVSEVIGALLEVIQPIITLIQEMLGPVIEWLGEIVSEHMDGILETVSDVIGSIKKVLGGIIDFIAGVFTGDCGPAVFHDIFIALYPCEGFHGLFRIGSSCRIGKAY